MFKKMTDFLQFYFKLSLYTLALLGVRTSGAPLRIILGKMLHMQRTIDSLKRKRKNQKSLVVIKFTAIQCQ
jgi:hypothetical protein